MPMMEWEYAHEIAKRFGLRVDDVKWAVDDTIRHLQEYPGGRRRSYKELLPQASALVREWLEFNHDWAVDVLDPGDVVQFIRSRAPGCAWAVMQAKIRELTPEDRLEAGFRLIREWLDAQAERRTAVVDLHRRLREMEEDDVD